MAAESSKQRELQEKSIKARKNELFVGEAADLAGPRKTFHQVLRETPAAPLSKNVKLMLWGSAAPVALLFVASLLRVGNATNVTTPAEPSISLAGTKPAPSKPSGEPAPTAEAARTDQPAAEAGSKPETPPEQKEKPKKPKKVKKKTPPKKEETAVAKGDEAPKPDEAKPDETGKPSKVASSEPDKSPSSEPDKDRDRDKAASGETETRSASKSKSKSSSGPDARSDANAPEKPKRERLFKTKKPPVFTYPKKSNEKKDESDKSGANPASP
jgi:hypothetical protein